MTTTNQTIEKTWEEECDNDEPTFTDENGKEWYSNVFLFNISNLVFKEDCELTDGVKALIKSHLLENYSLVEIDYNEWSNDTQAAEILYERIEEEFGEYVEDDYEADIEFETYGDYEGNFYDKEEMDKLVAVKGWVD